MRLAPALLLITLAAAALLPGGDAAAQEVELRGASDVALDRRLARLLGEDPLVVTRDTLIARGDTVRRAVLVLGETTLTLEGAILDDLVLVQAGAFVRPGSHVAGDLVNIGGGLYRSEIATVDGTILDLPTAPYRVEEDAGRYVIVASDAPSPLELEGLRGLMPPTYDRVNGLTVQLGATYRFPLLGDVQPFVHGRAGWRTELGEPVYGAAAGARWGPNTLTLGYEHDSDTNDDWVRGDLMNSLNYLLSGKDYRDYHEVDRAWAALTRAFGDEQKSLHGRVGARFQVEDARSLPGDDPWFLLGDTTRANPPVDEGRVTSVIADASLVWVGRETAFDGTLAVEQAVDAFGLDFPFNRVTVDAEWAMRAFADHTLEIETHLQLPLGGGSMPRQRWSFVGGSGTLQTLEFAEFHGDRVLYVESQYIVPLPERVAIPVLSAPTLHLVHAAGMAWTAAERPPLRQEIGARLQFFSLYFRYMLEPTDPSNADLDIGLSWPFGGRYPWQR